MSKLYNWQIISKLVMVKLLSITALLMRNFIANFVGILGMCKDFAGKELMNLETSQDVALFPSSRTSK